MINYELENQGLYTLGNHPKKAQSASKHAYMECYMGIPTQGREKHG